MTNALWRALARIVSTPWAFAWLLKRAQRTPYTHITSSDGKDVYMYRWWLFNPYSTEKQKQGAGSDQDNRRWPRLPSIRVHGIMRADLERDRHNHPWDFARTIVLHGAYVEEREVTIEGQIYGQQFVRGRGQTATLNNDVYHRITGVSRGGVFTLFITWRKTSSWGFKVDGKHVPWREYLGIK